MICYFIVIIQLFLFWSIIYFIGQAMIGIISFDAVFYISISHVDHLQSCFWVRWCGFCKWGLSGASPMEWAIEPHHLWLCNWVSASVNHITCAPLIDYLALLFHAAYLKFYTCGLVNCCLLKNSGKFSHTSYALLFFLYDMITSFDLNQVST